MFNKRLCIINIILIIVISTIFHFAYELLPNNIIASFFPVNESIIEHMKMIFNSYIVYTIIEYFILKKYNIIENNNHMFKLLTSSLICMFLTMIFYYPFYYTFGDNFIYTMSTYILSIIISSLISCNLNKDLVSDKYMNILSFIIILLLEFIFIYSTFNPKEAELFIDHTNNKIGVFNYIEAPKED